MAGRTVCLLRARSHSETCCRSSVWNRSGSYRAEWQRRCVIRGVWWRKESEAAGWRATRSKRERERGRDRGERRERHARSLFPRISGTLSALLARITHTASRATKPYREFLPPPPILLLSLLEFSSINRSQLLKFANYIMAVLQRCWSVFVSSVLLRWMTDILLGWQDGEDWRIRRGWRMLLRIFFEEETLKAENGEGERVNLTPRG